MNQINTTNLYIPKTSNNTMESYDTIIVSAGPAGLKCAEVLAEAEKEVLVLEKNEDDRP